MKGKRITMPSANNVILEDYEIDEAIAEDQVLMKTHYSLISPGTECAGYTALQSGTRFPHGSGYTAVGEVLKVGQRVKKCVSGDIVFSYAPHASIVKTNSIMLALKRPVDIDEKLIPFVRMATVAMTSMRVASAEFGDTVVIIGLGLVGNYASQLFTLAGMKVISIEKMPMRLESASKCGIRYLINPEAQNPLERVKELTNGQGAETTVEAIGNPRLIEMAFQLTKHKGEVILLGSPRGEYITDVTNILDYVHSVGKGSITLKSAHEWVFPTMHSGESKHSIERNTQIAYNLFKDGKLKAKELLTHVINPADAKSAYDGLVDKKDEYLGVVMDWSTL
ncbi:MAG: zinc-binding alcohol dehydrogenase [Candidatus Poribacteria bacterium]